MHTEVLQHTLTDVFYCQDALHRGCCERDLACFFMDRIDGP